MSVGKSRFFEMEHLPGLLETLQYAKEALVNARGKLDDYLPGDDFHQARAEHEGVVYDVERAIESCNKELKKHQKKKEIQPDSVQEKIKKNL